MIYYLLYPLHEHPALSFLNVLRYVPFRVLAATMTAMLLTFGLYPWFIRTLQSKQIGQVVRQDGPASHFSKAGTPTMGGALILLAMIAATVLWADPHNAMLWLVAVVTATYGGIGYMDDSAKIRKKHSGGLSARTRLLLEFGIALSVCGYLWYGEAGLPEDWQQVRDRVNLPFVAFDRFPISLPTWLYVVLAAIWVVGISNAVNLTDGLDGLAISTFGVAAAAFTALAYVTGHAVLADYLLLVRFPPAGELTIFCGALVGASLGFLWYNCYPAEIFMGDVGSLALGGAIGTVAILIKQELLLVIVGGVFVMEAGSVVIQVVSFKLTGKRVFRMAPLHHHFELLGWSEPKVIFRFLILAVIFALFSLTSLKLR